LAQPLPIIDRCLITGEQQNDREGIRTVSQSKYALRDVDYVLTLEEIGALAAAGGKPAETLMNVVALIAKRFQTDVCSAYLLEPDRANLVLAASLAFDLNVSARCACRYTKGFPVWWQKSCARSRCSK
jgi:hypothetical protein